MKTESREMHDPGKQWCVFRYGRLFRMPAFRRKKKKKRAALWYDFREENIPAAGMDRSV